MPPIALSLAVQFIIAIEKYNAPISWITTDKGFAVGTPSIANKVSGANKVNIPASPSTKLLIVINSFVFISSQLITLIYNFANLLTTFAAVAGRSIFPPWWMPIGVSNLVYPFSR